MARKQTTASQQQLLERTLSTLTAFIQDLSPQAEIEITFEQYDDEDAHIAVRLPPTLASEDVEHLEMNLGERCNDILLETGLFIVGAVSR